LPRQRAAITNLHVNIGVVVGVGDGGDLSALDDDLQSKRTTIPNRVQLGPRAAVHAVTCSGPHA